MHNIVFSKKKGTRKVVKNLGWLLRHAGEVRSILLVHRENGAGAMKAELNEHFFDSEFASFKIMETWINRPSLKGVSIYRDDYRQHSIL